MNELSAEQLVESSPLKVSDKKRLSEYISLQGDDAGFYKMFEEYLISEANEQAARFLEIIKEFAGAAFLLEDDFLKKKEELNKKREKALESLDLFDTKRQEEALSEYERGLDHLQSEYGKGIREKTAKLIASTI